MLLYILLHNASFSTYQAPFLLSLPPKLIIHSNNLLNSRWISALKYPFTAAQKSLWRGKGRRAKWLETNRDRERHIDTGITRIPVSPATNSQHHRSNKGAATQFWRSKRGRFHKLFFSCSTPQRMFFFGFPVHYTLQ